MNLLQQEVTGTKESNELVIQQWRIAVKACNNIYGNDNKEMMMKINDAKKALTDDAERKRYTDALAFYGIDDGQTKVGDLEYYMRQQQNENAPKQLPVEIK